MVAARFLTFLCACFIAIPAWGATVSVSIGVPRLQVSQSTTLSVTINGERPTAPPAFEDTDGYQIRFRDSRNELVNTPQTGIVRTYRFTFVIQALQEGLQTVPSIDVAVPSGTLSTNPVRFAVVPRVEPTAGQAEIEVTTAFTHPEAWEGEVVLYEAVVRARTRIRSATWRWPKFEGLQVPNSVGPERTSTVVGDPTGDITTVRTVVPLIAAGTGDRTQPPAVANLSVPSGRRSPFGSFGRQRQEVGTQAPLKVRPLPAAPPGYSGLVGSFRFSSALQKTQKVKVGESVNWTVTVVGDGVLDGFELPEIDKLAGVRIYRDDSAIQSSMVSGGFVSKKAFRLVLVPTERGVIELPPLVVKSFDPESGTYVTHEVEVGKLSVMGSGTELQVEDFGEPAETVDSEDTITLAGVYTWGPATSIPLAPVLPLALLFALAPGGLVLLADGGSAVRRVWSSRASGTREARGSDRLRALPSEPAARLAVLDLALREALVDAHGASAGRSEMLDALGDRAPAVREAFDALDRARFAGDGDTDLVAMVRDAIGVVGR